MGRNSKSSKPNSPFCEKLLKAFGMHPKIIKFNPSPSRHEQQQRHNNFQQVHVHHDEANYVAPEMEKKQISHKNSGDDQDVNDVFSDYINRAKRRLGNIASKRHHDSSSKGKENLKEDRRFSDYIVRARNKLRTTSSSVGFSKSSSGVK